MRFEAKHYYFKRLAQGLGNFKNLPKSLATRHQRLQCYWLCEDGEHLKSDAESGPGNSINNVNSASLWCRHHQDKLLERSLP